MLTGAGFQAIGRGVTTIRFGFTGTIALADTWFAACEDASNTVFGLETGYLTQSISVLTTGTYTLGIGVSDATTTILRQECSSTTSR